MSLLLGKEGRDRLSSTPFNIAQYNSYCPGYGNESLHGRPDPYKSAVSRSSPGAEKKIIFKTQHQISWLQSCLPEFVES